VSKVNLASAAADAGWLWAVGVIMVSSILALIYIGRVLLLAYFQSPPKVNGVEVARNEAPIAMLIPMWFLALSSIFIGIKSDAVVGAATRAAEFLLGAG
jgi:multicomponent Na+:H+ antiporter subunit D